MVEPRGREPLQDIPVGPLLPNQNILVPDPPPIIQAGEFDDNIIPYHNRNNEPIELINVAVELDPHEEPNEMNHNDRNRNNEEFFNEDGNDQEEVEEEDNEDNDFMHNNHADERGWNPDAIMEDLTWEKV